MFSGYMFPEYAMHGNFSIKSDVYSYEVLLLEIISGKKNHTFSLLGIGEDMSTYVSHLGGRFSHRTSYITI